MRRPHFMLALMSVSAFGCSTSGVSAAGATITGSWGGPHIGLTLTAAGGTTSYDCAHGGLGAPIVVDGSGNFDVRGVHVREHGGPVRMDEVPDSIPARYFGQVSDGRMTMRVGVGVDTLGPFDLQLGAAPQLFRCL